MKILNKVNDLYSNIEVYAFESNNKILLWLFALPYRIEFNIKRLGCYIFGCEERGGYGGFNLPYEAYYYECKRCGASESNYEGNSDYKFLEGIFKRRQLWQRVKLPKLKKLK